VEGAAKLQRWVLGSGLWVLGSGSREVRTSPVVLRKISSSTLTRSNF
jgi:hypothetical protein